MTALKPNQQVEAAPQAEVRDEAWSQRVLAEAGIHGVYDLVPMADIEATVHEIVEQFQPERVILFGSYAYGTPQPGSDVDLLVVMETENSLETTLDIYSTVTYRFPMDLHVRTPAYIKDASFRHDKFISEIVGRGKVLYEA